MFYNRFINFDEPAANIYSEIIAIKNRSGTPIRHEDVQIIAICRVHKSTLATRNMRDFEGCGIKVVNPWQKK